MGKPYWLWVAVPLVALPWLVWSVTHLPPTAVQPIPQASGSPPDPLASRDGVYVLAQDHFGPTKAAVLVVNGRKAVWYRSVIASSTSPDAVLLLGKPDNVTFQWEDHPVPIGFFSGTLLKAKPDAVGRLLVKVDYLAPPLNRDNTTDRAYNEFILKKTNLTEPPHTLKELIDAYGPPEVIP